MGDLLDHATTFMFVPSGTDRADLDTRHFRVKAEWRGEDSWVVSHSLGLWNGIDWEYEPTSSGYTEDFIARTRFTREQACTLAQQLADTVELDGLPWTGWKARRDAVRASAGQ
jgi:hypothetical protein